MNVHVSNNRWNTVFENIPEWTLWTRVVTEHIMYADTDTPL